MRDGIYLEELNVTTRPCEIEQLGPKTLRMILTQGVNRQIRRMCKSQGYEVTSLKRTRVMNIKLGNLKPGAYEEITGESLKKLYQACGFTR